MLMIPLPACFLVVIHMWRFSLAVALPTLHSSGGVELHSVQTLIKILHSY